MLITVDEYFDMGFNAPSEEAAEKAIKRAGFIISSLTDGRAEEALAENGEAADHIRHALGFQAELLVNEAQLMAATSESVTLGDFSYRQSASESGGERINKSRRAEIIDLLRAAGVLFKGVDVNGC